MSHRDKLLIKTSFAITETKQSDAGKGCGYASKPIWSEAGVKEFEIPWKLNLA